MISKVTSHSEMFSSKKTYGKKTCSNFKSLPVTISHNGSLLCKLYDSADNCFDDLVIDIHHNAKLFILSDLHFLDKDLASQNSISQKIIKKIQINFITLLDTKQTKAIFLYLTEIF